MKYQSDYPIPAITTTAVIVTDNKMVLLVKRKNNPFKGQWCLPGGFFNQFESARDCCVREVKEETGLDISSHCPWQPFDVISNKDRDPRGWVIDCPFLIPIGGSGIVSVTCGDDTCEADWFRFELIGKGVDLAFDHNMTFLHAQTVLGQRKYFELH